MEFYVFEQRLKQINSDYQIADETNKIFVEQHCITLFKSVCETIPLKYTEEEVKTYLSKNKVVVYRNHIYDLNNPEQLYDYLNYLEWVYNE